MLYDLERDFGSQIRMERNVSGNRETTGKPGDNDNADADVGIEFNSFATGSMGRFSESVGFQE